MRVILPEEFVSEFLDLLRWVREEYGNAQDPKEKRELWIRA
jgi:hypothetical protein